MRTRAVVPFVVCALIGFALLLQPPHRRDATELVITGVLLLVVLGSAVAVALPWERWPTWTHAIAPLSFFVVIALMIDVSGGVAFTASLPQILRMFERPELERPELGR